MTSAFERFRETPRWRLGFYPAALVLLVLVVAPPSPALETMGFLLTGWGSTAHHAVHFTVGGVFHVALVAALLSLFYRPERRTGVLGTVLVLALTAPVAFAVIGDVVPPAVLLPLLAVLLAVLHPDTRAVLVPSVDGYDRRLLALALAAAAPLVLVGVDHMLLQRVVEDQHAALGHYAHVGATFVAAGVLGILASLRPTGWRVPTYAAAAIVAVAGAASIAWPAVSVQGTGFGALGGVVAILWSVAFVGIAEVSPAAPASATDEGVTAD